MSTLKPCPFCGGTKICTEKSINLNYCDNCSAESNIEHWNTRPIEDALNARIAELEAERRWIPVSERLPDKRLPVLVYTIYGETYSAMLLGEVWTGLHRDFRKGEITHWMPLPEPPKEREE